MKLRTKIAVVTVVAVLFGCTLYHYRAFAQAGGAGLPWRLGLALSQLGATEEQTAQVKEILKKYQPAIQPMIKEMVAGRRDLRSLVQSDSLDEAAIRA